MTDRAPDQRLIYARDFLEALEAYKLSGHLPEAERREAFFRLFPFPDLLEFANVGANTIAARHSALIMPRIGTDRERTLG